MPRAKWSAPASISATFTLTGSQRFHRVFQNGVQKGIFNGLNVVGTLIVTSGDTTYRFDLAGCVASTMSRMDQIHDPNGPKAAAPCPPTTPPPERCRSPSAAASRWIPGAPRPSRRHRVCERRDEVFEFGWGRTVWFSFEGTGGPITVDPGWLELRHRGRRLQPNRRPPGPSSLRRRRLQYRGAARAGNDRYRARCDVPRPGRWWRGGLRIRHRRLRSPAARASTNDDRGGGREEPGFRPGASHIVSPGTIRLPGTAYHQSATGGRAETWGCRGPARPRRAGEAGDHDAFAMLASRRRAAGRGGPADPQGPGARARRGPGRISSPPGGTCRRSATRIGSTPGFAGWSSIPASTPCADAGAG